MKKLILLYLFCSVILACKNITVNKYGEEKIIKANFKLLQNNFESSKKYNYYFNNKYKYRYMYLCKIINEKSYSIYIPCGIDTFSSISKSKIYVLSKFQDSIFYNRKSMQKYQYKIPYYETNSIEIESGSEKEFVFSFQRNDYVTNLNIDSIIFDISYINGSDTTKQFIYFAKSNVDSFPKFPRE